MKKLVLALALGSLVVAAPTRAHDAYDDTQSHPLLLLSYLLHPVGFAAEWIVMRPIHFAVSEHPLDRVFGHRPHEDPFGYYDNYEHMGFGAPMGRCGQAPDCRGGRAAGCSAH